jgi:MipA family protein
MMKSIPILLLIFIMICPMASAEDLPLWELGIGFAAAQLPDYRGAEESKSYLFPTPYVVYRGDILKAEGARIKGQIFESNRFKLDISLSGSLPVNSDDNQARSNMPDLDLTGEIGPSLELNIWKNVPDSLWLKIPLRSVLSVDRSNLAYRGLILAPSFQYDWEVDLMGWWKMSLSLGPIFATRRYHEYFYEVDAPYATQGRHEYHPGGGYSGTTTSLGLQKHYHDFWIGAYARYDRLSDAAFEESPLVKSKDYLSAGVIMTWFFAKSGTLVKQVL